VLQKVKLELLHGEKSRLESQLDAAVEGGATMEKEISCLRLRVGELESQQGRIQAATIAIEEDKNRYKVCALAKRIENQWWISISVNGDIVVTCN
jgi:hypothetical protein